MLWSTGSLMMIIPIDVAMTVNYTAHLMLPIVAINLL